jgi:hypothetical protein
MLICAGVVCAFGAPSASAAVAKSTTAFTCVSSGGSTNKDFKDAHCDEQVAAGTGSFEHLAIPINQKVEVSPTNEKVTENTTKSEPAVLKSAVAGGKVTITCQVAKGKGTFQNVEPEPGIHRGSGSGSTEMSECAAAELAHCAVAEPIVVNVTAVPLEGLTGPKGEENAMGGEVIGAGEKETFAQIEFKNKGTEKCSLSGVKFTVGGSLIATSGPTTEAKQNNKWSGATAVYTPKFNMENLKLGENVAEFSLITTVRATATGNPLSGTTVT